MKALFLSLSALLIIGCKGVTNSSMNECYHVAKHKYEGEFKDIANDILETHLLMSDAHYLGQLLHIPIMYDRSLYFGGLCSETSLWIQRLKEEYAIETITEERYDEHLEWSKGGYKDENTPSNG